MADITFMQTAPGFPCLSIALDFWSHNHPPGRGIANSSSRLDSRHPAEILLKRMWRRGSTASANVTVNNLPCPVGALFRGPHLAHRPQVGVRGSFDASSDT
ncbi:hypothetical protein [Sediminicoccus sp. KRV36]|uniref:hypothetical protein n=1 Tax=Sediminicoccus sp. KRV36 TaxID=3133721 RepID=UPI00200E4132|nr:hypothetical protein [Sediminicoccus rosea]UPY38296.1 hypothetical protein LHU95_06250 [Sediminicoccus rosea]